MPYADLKIPRSIFIYQHILSITKRNNKTENDKWIFSLKRSVKLVAN